MSNDNSSISYIKILDTDTRSIEMHRIKCDLVESRNKSKLKYNCQGDLSRLKTLFPLRCQAKSFEHPKYFIHA